MSGIPGNEIKPLKEILEVGLYDEGLRGELIDCKDWDNNKVTEFVSDIPPEHDLFLPVGFLESIEKDPYQLYCDTDSDYLLIKLTFDKNQDHRKTVDYCQKLTLRMNEAYIAALDLYFYKIANWHPDFNTMDFKSEVVAFRGFFCTKKFYALGKVWDEGKFLGKLETKKTGGQLRKADVTKVTKEMLTEIYQLLTVDQTIKDEVVIYNKIFVEIKNKYVFKLKSAIKNLEFEYFTVPKKWSFGEKKSIPPQINGARLYNRIIKDTFSMGDAVLVLPIKYNMPLMKKEFEKLHANDNMLQNKELTAKIKDISLPPAKKITDKDKELILSRFKELEIVPDYDEIMNFNIDMKLEPFKKLFSLEVTRKAKVVSEYMELKDSNVSI
jgi:hypothetical protein